MQSVSPYYITQIYGQVGSTTIIETAQPDNTNDAVPPHLLTDGVNVSNQGRELSRKTDVTHSSANSVTSSNTPSETIGKNTLPDRENSDVDMAALKKLQTRDSEVRSHEQSHLSAAGQYALGGASFVYQRGTDGKNYAIGGEVSIDMGREISPEATIAKMQTVKRAALAPANPSSADRQIAAQASATLAQAQREIQQDNIADINGVGKSEHSGNNIQSSTSNEPPSSSGGAMANRRVLMAETYRAVNDYL